MAKKDSDTGGKKKSKLKIVVIVLVALVVIGAFGSAGKGQTSGSGASSSQTTASQAPQADDNVPTEYKTALNKAESYSNTMHMSKQGIYDQLTSEYGENYS